MLGHLPIFNKIRSLNFRILYLFKYDFGNSDVQEFNTKSTNSLVYLAAKNEPQKNHRSLFVQLCSPQYLVFTGISYRFDSTIPCSVQKNWWKKKKIRKKERWKVFVEGEKRPMEAIYFFLLFFFSEESYRACRRNMIHKRIQRNVWPGPKRFNKFFFPPFRVQSSLQLRQPVPFPTEQTIISSVWFHLEKRLIDQRMFDKHPFFLALSIHDTTIDHLSNVGKVDTFISLFLERISSFVSLANAIQSVKGWFTRKEMNGQRCNTRN